MTYGLMNFLTPIAWIIQIHTAITASNAVMKRQPHNFGYVEKLKTEINSMVQVL